MAESIRRNSLKCSAIFFLLLVLSGSCWAEPADRKPGSAQAKPDSDTGFRPSADTWQDLGGLNVLSPEPRQPRPEPLREVENALLAHYAQWVGTRHRLGGTDFDGIDCSGFIQILFQERFNMHLPRSSREQMQLGEPVAPDQLQTGDLLFFRTGPTRSHVGVYLGSGQFLHVSVREGVQLARLLSPYWKKNFIAAKRLLMRAVTPSN